MVSLLILEQVVKYLVMIMAGFIIVRCGLLKPGESRVLSVLCIYVFTPCAIIQAFQVHAAGSVRQLQFSFVAAVLIHALLILAGAVLARMFRMNEVEMLSVVYSNAGNMILPLVAAVLGGEWVLYASAYMSVQMALIWTHGVSVMCHGDGFHWKKILLNVNMLAIIAGMVLFASGWGLPRAVNDMVGVLGGMLAPAVMLSIGMMLAGIGLRAVFRRRRVYFICAVRLVLMPLLVLAVIYFCRLLFPVGNSNTLLFISFLATTTSSAATVTQMAQVYGQDGEYAGMINAMSTVFCLVTMPLLTGLYDWLMPVLP